MRCWCVYLSGATWPCRLFACGPADASVIPQPPHFSNPDWFYLSGTDGLIQVVDHAEKAKLTYLKTQIVGTFSFQMQTRVARSAAQQHHTPFPSTFTLLALILGRNFFKRLRKHFWRGITPAVSQWPSG